MTTSSKLAWMSVAIGVGACLWWGLHGHARGPAIVSSPAKSQVEDPAEATSTDAARSSNSERAVIAPSADGTEGSTTISAPESIVALATEGRVIDERGNPIAGMKLVAHADELPRLEDGRLRGGDVDVAMSPAEIARLRGDAAALAVFLEAHLLPGIRALVLGESLDGHGETAADGTFRIELKGPRESSVTVLSEDAHWTLFTFGYAPNVHTRVYIAAPPLTVEGVVVESDGTPIEKAGVYVSLNPQSLRHLPIDLTSGMYSTRNGESTSTGSFRIESLPLVDGLMVRAIAPEHCSATALVTADRASSMRLVLAPLVNRRVRSVSGIVVDAEGQPAVNALVAFGSAESSTDSSGRFDLRVGTFSPTSTLVAVVDGVAIGREADVAALLASSTADVDGVVIHVERTTLEIAGRVLDAHGGPCVGWDVDIYDPTPAASGRSAESRASGGKTEVKSSVDGGFRITGLLPRSYRVCARNAKSHGFVLSDPIEAGAHDVEVRILADAMLPRVAGRVVTRKGEPVIGVTVGLDVETARNDQGSTIGRIGSSVKTDDRGQFELHDVPRRNVTLFVSGDEIARRAIDFADVPNAEAIEVVVGRVCSVRLDLDAHGAVDAVAFVNGNGQPLEVTVRESFDLPRVTRLSRDEAGFPACGVPDEATAIVLYRGDVELRRTPISLSSQALNFLRP